MNILVTGSSGQIGSELKKISKKINAKWIFSSRNQIDYLNFNDITKKLNIISPNYIINCAAYTNVDNAEIDKDNAQKINYLAVKEISKWSSSNNCRLIHISTDYIFDGKNKSPIEENYPASPINFYGLTKLDAENTILKLNKQNSIILRTSWVYSSFGKNFVKAIINRMSSNNTLNVVNDQIGSPTYAEDIANAIITIINRKNWNFGIYNFTGNDELSWYEFAKYIKKISGHKSKIFPISSDMTNNLASRPRYSRLDNRKIKRIYGISHRPLEFCLNDCIKKIKDE